MSQRNETLPLVLALFVTAGVVGSGLWWYRNTIPTPKPPTSGESTVTSNSKSAQLSLGDKLLIADKITPEKQAAIEALKQGNYNQAVAQLEATLQASRNDPEALIYLNNARIGNNKAYTIATSVPIGVEINAAEEMLRGVAQAQNEVNLAGGINGVPLQVIIANDNNDPQTAKQVAEKFASNKDILGVVGHFGSNVTLAGAQVYQNQGLVAISPTSTSVSLSKAGNYIFRTVTSDNFAGKALSNYMLKQLKQQKAAVFFNSQSNYSESLKDVFTTDLFASGGEVVAEFDFAQEDFQATKAMKQVMAQEAQVLMLAPNSATLDQALDVIQVNDGRLPMLGGDSAYKPKTLEIGRGDVQGMVLAVPWHFLGNPNAQFPRTARQLWGGDVNWRTAMAYDATQALIAALQTSPNPSRQSIQQALSQTGFTTQGAAGTIRFLPSGDRNQPVQLVTIEPDLNNSTNFDYKFVPVP